MAEADTDDFDRYRETAKYRSHHVIAPGAVTLGGMRVLFTATQIAARVEALAAEIARTIPGEFVIVGLLKGAAVFVADLIRALARAGARPRDRVHAARQLRSRHREQRRGAASRRCPGLPRRPLLLVDDIVDTGRSIAYAAAELYRRGIGELWICALLDKPQRRQIEIAIDFVGFSVPDLFVVGYGTDYAEKCRHLPYVGAIE